MLERILTNRWTPLAALLIAGAVLAVMLTEGHTPPLPIGDDIREGR